MAAPETNIADVTILPSTDATSGSSDKLHSFSNRIKNLFQVI